MPLPPRFPVALVLIPISVITGGYSSEKDVTTPHLSEIYGFNESEPTELKLLPELSQYLLSGDELITPTSESVQRDDIEHDVAFLEVFLRGSYAGYDRAEAEGFSWSTSFDLLRTSQPMPIDLWQDSLVKAFAGLKDGHFSFSLVDTQGRFTMWRGTFSKAFKRYEASADCASATDLAPYFENGVLHQKAISYSTTEPQDGRCTWQVVAATSAKRPSKPSVSALGDEIYLVNAHDFQSHRRDFAVWEELHKSLTAIRAAKSIVIDLRGNGGGDDHEFYLWLNELVGRRLPTAVYQRLTSPWTHLSLVNSLGEELTRGNGDARWQEQMKAWQRSSLDSLTRVTPETLGHRHWETWDRATVVEEPLSNSPFSGRILVLVDRFCASACELAVKTLRTIPGTVLAGEPTAGMTAVGNNTLHRLPGSNLKIQWGNWLERDLSVDTESYQEGRGFIPDIWLAPNSAESVDEIHALAAAVQSSQ